jgi:pilus assembly protein CpaD
MTRPHLHLSRIAATGLLLTLLTACASAGGSDASLASRNDTEQWASKVQVDAHPDEILLVPHAEGLSVAQTQAIDALLGRWLAAEGREIVVSAPMGGPSGEAAGRMAFSARQRLVAMGAPAAAVRVVGYDAAAAPDAPLKVGFLRYQVQTPQCGTWENLTATRNNNAYGNFGCAITANMAAQVANPADLLSPRASNPVDASRRDTVIDKYRKGETTSSAKDEQATGSLSKAVN